MCDFVSFWHIPKQVKGNFELGGGGGKKKTKQPQELPWVKQKYNFTRKTQKEVDYWRYLPSGRRRNNGLNVHSSFAQDRRDTNDPQLRSSSTPSLWCASLTSPHSSLRNPFSEGRGRKTSSSLSGLDGEEWVHWGPVLKDQSISRGRGALTLAKLEWCGVCTHDPR